MNNLRTYPGKISRLVERVWRHLRFEARERRFCDHNEKIWPRIPPAAGSREVLVEVFPVASAIIAQSYLMNLLAKRHGAKIVAYNTFPSTWVNRIYSWSLHRLYRSFHATSFLFIDTSRAENREARALAEALLPTLRSKKDVEDLCVDGTWIGDILYDSFLMQHKLPTIDLGDPRFMESLVECLRYYVFWRNYLNRHPVAAAVVSHCVYFQNAMIVRLCVARGLPCYQVNATSVYSLSQKHVRAYNEYLYLPEEFRGLSAEEQRRGLALAKERLELRFKGAVGVDMHYSTKSAFATLRETPILRPSDRLKVLIAPHCFFDSPHPYGNNLFPDFYDWLEFVGKISERTDYDWYIKTHPDFLPGNVPILAEFARKYPKFTILPSDCSHLQLIREGIDVALTVYGTIGCEYAALGKTVINASRSNPHVAYGFNLHVGDVDEYERILMNLESLELKIDPEKVYEYYFMARLNKSENWLFRDYRKFIGEVGGHQGQIQPAAYEYFLAEFTPERHREVVSVLERFLDSGSYYLSSLFFP